MDDSERVPSHGEREYEKKNTGHDRRQSFQNKNNWVMNDKSS